jgi:ABC-type multidrug transport system ATPase subunit
MFCLPTHVVLNCLLTYACVYVVLMKDEATAHVDLDTDATVQRAIHEAFPRSTVLMVAHRILTVIDCHQVLVMAKGVVAEAGHPHELLSKYLGDILLTESADIDDDVYNTGTTEDTDARQVTLAGGAINVDSLPSVDSKDVTDKTTPLEPPPQSLAAMVLQLGPIMTTQLRRAAAEAWKEHQRSISRARLQK